MLRPGGPTVAELADVGVRRVSLGGALAHVAYGAMVRAAESLLATGTLARDLPFLDRSLAASAFGPSPS